MMFDRTVNLAGATLAMGLLAAVSGPAAAAPDEARMRQVRHSDLDLTTRDGLASLDARLSTAIRRVCGDAPARGARGASLQAQCRMIAKGGSEPRRSIVVARAAERAAARPLALAGAAPDTDPNAVVALVK